MLQGGQSQTVLRGAKQKHEPKKAQIAAREDLLEANPQLK